MTLAAFDSMVEVRAGTFAMGSDNWYPEERPIREVTVDGFLIDRHPVTNQQFAEFVADTAYVTLAERAPDPCAYPDAAPGLLVPGSSVFLSPPGPVDMRDLRNWWAYVPGASWRHPEGPDSNVDERQTHPVVHVAYEDAAAYAAWAGKQLPSEEEWEYAARGGLAGADYAWGDTLHPGGRRMANIWDGTFPWHRAVTDFERTSPVGSFPANGYGLNDMIGNVWEWTASPPALPPEVKSSSCCSASAPTGESNPVRVVKGGSWLCSLDYCRRYRPAARQAQPVDSSTSHIGFRCVIR